MKKQLIALSLLLSSFAHASDFQLDNLSKNDVEKVTKEFATNFTHTTVSAPSTNGLWGVEFGVIASTMSSPKLADIVTASGGKGKDFESLYSGGGFLRIHVPFEFFFESSILPKLKLSDVETNNMTFGLGWNAGRFLNLPFDLAVGYDVSNGEISFNQNVVNGMATAGTKVALESRTQKAWIGISKKLLIFTPYAKVGVINMNSDLSVDASIAGTIFNYTNAQKENVKESSTYWVAGAQVDLLLMSIGLETMSALGNTRYTGKISFSF